MIIFPSRDSPEFSPAQFTSAHHNQCDGVFWQRLASPKSRAINRSLKAHICSVPHQKSTDHNEPLALSVSNTSENRTRHPTSDHVELDTSGTEFIQIDPSRYTYRRPDLLYSNRFLLHRLRLLHWLLQQPFEPQSIFLFDGVLLIRKQPVDLPL